MGFGEVAHYLCMNGNVKVAYFKFVLKFNVQLSL